MTQVRGTFPELNSNYKKATPKVKPLPLHKVIAPTPKKKAK